MPQIRESNPVRSRASWGLAGLLLAALLLAPGCGDARPPGGTGSLQHTPGSPDVLVLAGTPFQMGWWQGHLLRERIRRSAAARHAAVFGRGANAETLRAAVQVYADQTLRRLPEGARQELEGLSQGSGIGMEDLLFTEVLADGLRFHSAPRRLPGDLRVTAAGPEVRCVPRGGDASLFGSEALVVERRPGDGPASLVVAWPGSLGGLAGTSVGGLAALALEVDVPTEEQSLSEEPFPLRLRRALERATDPDDLLVRLAGGTAHRVVVLSADRVLLGLAARSATPTADLEGLPFFVLLAEGEAGDVDVPTPGSVPGTEHLEMAVPQPYFGVRFGPSGGATLLLSGGGPVREARLDAPRAPLRD